MIRPKNGVSKVVKATEKLEKLFAERERIDAEIRRIKETEFPGCEAASERLLTTKSVADRFSVSRASVCNWVAHGQLQPVVKHPDLGYLFAPETVDSFTPPPKGNPRHREDLHPAPGLLQTKDIAERFGVTRQSVQNWIASGYLVPTERHPNFGYLFEAKSLKAFTPPSKTNGGHN